MPPKLRHDATPATSRRNGQYVGTQLAVHRHEERDERGMHEIQDKDARDSGQLLHLGDFFCIFALSFIKNGTAIHQERQMGN